jgi:hypothetical protein
MTTFCVRCPPITRGLTTESTKYFAYHTSNALACEPNAFPHPAVRACGPDVAGDGEDLIRIVRGGTVRPIAPAEQVLTLESAT